MGTSSGPRSASVRRRNGKFITQSKNHGKLTIIISSLRKIGRKIMWKVMTLLAGTLLCFNKRASFLIALLNSARTKPRPNAFNGEMLQVASTKRKRGTRQRIALPSFHQRFKGQRKRARQTQTQASQRQRSSEGKSQQRE
jgi:hypothetical protein